MAYASGKDLRWAQREREQLTRAEEKRENDLYGPRLEQIWADPTIADWGALAERLRNLAPTLYRDGVEDLVPTELEPGSEEKIRLMAERASRGLRVFADGDRQYERPLCSEAAEGDVGDEQETRRRAA
jgi:hypothetical protein